MSGGFLLALCLVLLLSSVPLHADNAVSWAYSLTSLGDDHYRYEFSFYNLGPDRDAIFKITIGQQSVSSNWITVLFENPTGWAGSHPNNALDWSAANGDITGASPGIGRLWGQQGAPIGPGAINATFLWTFVNIGGPSPTEIAFDPAKVKIHLQPISAEWRNVDETYTTSPVPEPAGILAFLSGVVGTIGLILRRRR